MSRDFKKTAQNGWQLKAGNEELFIMAKYLTLQLYNRVHKHKSDDFGRQLCIILTPLNK